jgi:hypothetical protein
MVTPAAAPFQNGRINLSSQPARDHVNGANNNPIPCALRLNFAPSVLTLRLCEKYRSRKGAKKEYERRKGEILKEKYERRQVVWDSLPVRL